MANPLPIRSVPNDPLPAFRYYIILADGPGAPSSASAARSLFDSASGNTGFAECSGLDISVEVFPYTEGGVNDHTYKFLTRATHGDIILRRGMITNELSAWIQNVAVFGKAQRKDGCIAICTMLNEPAQLWRFTRGLPIKWSGPALAASKNEIATESLTIAHEGLVQLT